MSTVRDLCVKKITEMGRRMKDRGRGDKEEGKGK